MPTAISIARWKERFRKGAAERHFIKNRKHRNEPLQEGSDNFILLYNKDHDAVTILQIQSSEAYVKGQQYLQPPRRSGLNNTRDSIVSGNILQLNNFVSNKWHKAQRNDGSTLTQAEIHSSFLAEPTSATRYTTI